MITQQDISIENTLESLLNTEPENKFYQSLQKQYEERGMLTDRQTECLEKDYKEKIRIAPATPTPAEEKQTKNNTAPAETTKNVYQHTCADSDSENWKNSAAPTPGEIRQQQGLEDFIQNLLSSPDYGTRKKIMDQEIIKAIIGLIKEHMVRDCSHYNGYKPKAEQETKYQKTTLTFKENQLHKNGVALECRLDDPQFNGMRINSHGRDSISILLDFYHPQEGYSMKCVNFDVRRGGPTREKQSNRSITSTTDKETPIKPTQEEKTEKEQKRLF